MEEETIDKTPFSGVNEIANSLPPMPTIPPPLPPMPNSIPPPPPPPPDGDSDGDQNGEDEDTKQSKENDVSDINRADDDNNEVIDDNKNVPVPARSLLDAIGRSGMYTGETLFDSSSQSFLPQGNGGIMLYDDKIQVSTHLKKDLRPVKYCGEWMLGHWHGTGLLTLANGDSYSGQFKTSYKQGQGTYTWSDGRQYFGQFDNDFRHGHGKYTWPTEGDAVISYSGNFEKNQRNGFGTYIDEITGVEYSGEWKNGLYHGYGIYQWYAVPDFDYSSGGRNHQGRHAYRGNFRNGRPDGQGTEILPDGTIRHEGSWQDGDPVLSDDAQVQLRKLTNSGIVLASKASNLLSSSSAVMLSVATRSQSENNRHHDSTNDPVDNSDGSRNNEEDWRHSASATMKKKKNKKKEKINNLSVVENQQWKDTTTGCYCTYRGLWDATKNCPDGNGTAIYATGAVQSYEGQMKAGLYHGQGRLWYRNGDLYEGTFVAGQRHTSGEKDPITNKHATALYRWKDGRQYTGQFYCNSRQGYGILVYANQDLYEGDFVAGQREGYGRFVFASDGSCYTGQWQAGQYHGEGTLVMGNGFTYVGQFQNGYEQGIGCLRDPTGQLVYDGEWIRGKRRDEVDAAMQILKHDAEQKKSSVQEALSELDRIMISRNPEPHERIVATSIGDPLPSNNTVLRDWKDNDNNQQGKHGKGKRRMNTNRGGVLDKNIDNRPCEAVVNEPVTDLLGCPGYYTGIVDSRTRLPHGVGRLVYADGKRIHEGFWKEGSKDGHGRCLFFPQGDYHEGEYKNNLRHGPGRYHWQDGRSFHGFYENDMRHGQGIFVYPGGERYEGNFSKGQRSGFGRFDFLDPINNDRQGFYEGLWKDGLYDGAGHIVWGDGVSFTGQFASGTFHGKGIKKYPTGNVIREGYWKHGVACDEEEFDNGLVPEEGASKVDDGEVSDNQGSKQLQTSAITIPSPALRKAEDSNTCTSTDLIAPKYLDSQTEEKKEDHEDESSVSVSLPFTSQEETPNTTELEAPVLVA